MEFRLSKRSTLALVFVGIAAVAGLISFTPVFAATNSTSTTTPNQSSTSGAQSTTSPTHHCPNMGSSGSNYTSSSTSTSGKMTS